MRTLKGWSILALGWAVVIGGFILIPLPGPGVLAILSGIMILSLESAWARWLLLRCKSYLRSRRPDVHGQLVRFQTGMRRRQRACRAEPMNTVGSGP